MTKEINRNKAIAGGKLFQTNGSVKIVSSDEELKKLLNDKNISEDESKKFEKNIQKLTDDNISHIDKISEDKEKEILQI